MANLRFTILLLIILTVSQKAFGQFNTTTHFHHLSFDNRAIALGQATAVLNNYGSYHVNPAIPNQNGELNFSSFIPSFNVLTLQNFGSQGNNDIHTYNPSISVGINKWSFSALYDYTKFYEIEPAPGIGTGPGEAYTPNYHIFRGNIGYQISNHFSLGLGLAHIRDFQGYGGFEFNKLEYTGVSFSLGSYYHHKFESASFLIEPEAGLAITDIADVFTLENDAIGLLAPGQIRLGLGVEFIYKKKLYNQPIFNLGFYTGFSKYLSRVEEDGNMPTGLEAIFSTWNSFQRFNGAYYETISLNDQISKSIGIEVGILETLYFRFGTFGGADYWVRPQTTFGAALDLYYLSFSYANVRYNSSKTYSFFQKNEHAFQMQVRIPLDGKKENSLLEELFQK